MDCRDRVTVLPFMIFAHIHEDGLGILGQPGADFVDGDFLDARFGVVDQFEEAG